MNSFLSFKNRELFNRAVNVLALDAIEYEVDDEAMDIHTNDPYDVAIALEAEGIVDFTMEDNSDDEHEPSLEGADDEHDQFRTDAEADGDALASAGMGTDEDYGCYGDNDE